MRKAMLTATGLGVLAVVAAVYFWSSHPSYVALYSGLDTADSGGIVTQLRAANAPYKLEAGGSTILVPQAQVDDLRVKFASEGLPAGSHTGFEVFNGNSFTATDFVQRLNFQRGLQGELERTLEAFPAVLHARVHVVLPQKSLFRDDQQPATASVVLALRPGRALEENEVSGMAHLVSGAVEGLTKDHITILNSNGQMIFDGASQGANGFGNASTQLGLQANYAHAIESSVQSMLDRALGPAKAAVNVRATLNFDQIETQTESYKNPVEKGVPRSTKTVSEAYTTGTGSTAGAVPGAVANVPGANANLPAGAATPAANGTTNYQRSENTSNFELDKTLTKQVAAAGGVKRLSVSLLLDESIKEDQAAKLQESVAAAVGLDKERGDTIVLTRMPFDKSALDDATKAFKSQASQDTMMGYIRIALPVLMLVLAFVFFRMLIRSVNVRSVRSYGVGAQGVAGMGGMMMLPEGVAPGAIGAASVLRSLPAAEMSAEEVRRSELEQSVQKMAHSTPETVAEVVQSWLRED